MNIFFDTSSLFKLYHREQGTTELMGFFNNNTIETIYLAEITFIEFNSVVWKKCRMKEIDEISAHTLLKNFYSDSEKYSYISQNHHLRMKSIKLIEKYWVNGLRALDSIQLASALKVKSIIDVFFSSDILLSELAGLEGLNTK